MFPDPGGPPPQPVSLEMIYYRLAQLETAVERGMAQIRADTHDIGGRVSTLEKDVIQIRERMTIYAAGQALFAAVASTIAAIIRR
jgi:hypothetical protein